MLSLTEWDRYVSPYLRDIETDSYYISHYTTKVVRSVEAIAARPSFDTRAECEIAHTIKKLETATQLLKKSLISFREKPLDE